VTRAQPAFVISAKIEAEIAVLPPAERVEYLAAIGLKEAGLDRLIRAGYALLNLITYFNRWPQGAAGLDDHPRHQGAAGRGRDPFGLRARLHPCRDHRVRRLCQPRRRGWRQAAGKMRLEGKSYVVADGDVMHFRFAT